MCTATLLKEKGLRITQQRVLIYEILDSNRIHPTVDMLYKLVSEVDDTIGIATVYKTIDAFKAQGIVRELKCENTPARYDINTSGHAHFECSVCNSFSDIMFVDVDQIIESNSNTQNYIMKEANIVFSGLCPNCN